MGVCTHICICSLSVPAFTSVCLSVCLPTPSVTHVGDGSEVVDLHLDQFLPVLLDLPQHGGRLRVLQGPAGLLIVVHHLAPGGREGEVERESETNIPSRNITIRKTPAVIHDGFLVVVMPITVAILVLLSYRSESYLSTDACHQKALPVVQHGLLQETFLGLAL